MNIWKKICKHISVHGENNSELLEAFKTTVDREYSMYLEKLLGQDKMTIINWSERTWFYTIVYDFVMTSDFINEMILESQDTDYPIQKMWFYYRQQEASCLEWEDIEFIMEKVFLCQKETLSTVS